MGEFCESSLTNSMNELKINLNYVAMVISVGHNSLKTFFSPSFPK